MAKNRTFLKMGPTNEFQTKFSGFSIQFGYRNCKNLKRILQLNWNIDAFYCVWKSYLGISTKKCGAQNLKRISGHLEITSRHFNSEKIAQWLWISWWKKYTSFIDSMFNLPIQIDYEQPQVMRDQVCSCSMKIPSLRTLSHRYAHIWCESASHAGMH